MFSGYSGELDFLQRFPVQALEKPGVLLLHGREEFVAAGRVRGGDRLVDQSGTQRAES